MEARRRGMRAETDPMLVGVAEVEGVFGLAVQGNSRLGQARAPRAQVVDREGEEVSRAFRRAPPGNLKLEHQQSLPRFHPDRAQTALGGAVPSQLAEAQHFAVEPSRALKVGGAEGEVVEAHDRRSLPGPKRLTAGDGSAGLQSDPVRSPRDLRIAFVGFGHVGRRFAERLSGPFGRAFRAAGIRPLVTGIATARHGVAAAPAGLPIERCLAALRAGRSLDCLPRGGFQGAVSDYIGSVPADVLVEITPLDPQNGEPAITHCRLALRRGLHVVTANKGPVAFALRRLAALAVRHRVQFRYEGAVMDGAPIFNLAALCLPGARVLGFRGVLNSTTSHVLSRMEEGRSAASALAEMQAAGIAEADPRHDLLGWDAALKACALANALMGASVRPRDVGRRGITGIGPSQIRRAARAGRRIRLVARGRRVGGRVAVSVAPRALALGDPLAASGPDAVLILETDLMGEIGVIERGATVDQTAYALLSDLLSICRGVAR